MNQLSDEQMKMKLHGIELEVDISEAQLAGGCDGDAWHVVFGWDDYSVELCASYEVLTAKLKEALGMLEDVRTVAAQRLEAGKGNDGVD